MPPQAKRIRLFSTLALAAGLGACEGSELPDGAIEGGRRADSRLGALDEAQRSAARTAAERAGPEASADKAILFGDLHVHTTWSIDAFLYGLPIFGGEGTHPPADACDFARYCSELDFYSLNDHAEGLTPVRWQQSLESVRECNARAGDPANPDLVAFAGWEWTQTGTTPETHFGHKNVIFPGTADEELPARPISSLNDDVMDRAAFLGVARVIEAVLAPFDSPYADFLRWTRQLSELPLCPPDVDTRELPLDCQENAPTPERLFAKLDQWGFERLVIPHGLSWGIHTPPGASMAVQLTPDRADPSQRLLEVYSGHGGAERFHPDQLRADDLAAEGVCAEPTAAFLPCCWQAGEIVRGRCADAGSSECDARVEEARRLTLEAGRRPTWALPDAGPEDWLDCDQVRGSFKEAMSPRPRQTAQAALALEHPEARDAEGRPLRFRFGLIGSSDNHTGRGGSGYKQVARKGMSDARGFGSQAWEERLSGFVRGEPDPEGGAVAVPPAEMGFRALLDVERGASFLYPGGLVAVHAAGRDRRSIWDALARREVYATSGPRILLWFELTNGPGGRAPMGSAHVLGEAPRFEVRAVGAAVQQPGCPESALDALSPERLQRLCFGECHNPSNQRHAISAIEVVRIFPGADPATLLERVDDPWQRFECAPDPAGCVVQFEDPDFGARDAVYYVRALQEATPAVNGATLRTEFDAEGNAVSVAPCSGAWHGREDDCLAPVQERAWSSPIFLDVADG